jgi:UDP-glucose:(glucosyl)LPS alpha-1,2-glucosyltransferase
MELKMETNELAQNAKGGTELMQEALYKNLPADLLEYFQIIPSRVREVDDSKIKIYWLHDLPGDPESEHLKAGGWNRFDKLVFVSNWQMQAYQKYYGLPWYKCVVLHNAIDPIPYVEKPKDKIKLIYHTTPHRGLNILVPVFDALCKEFDNIELDVYSSFKIYGWEQRDEPYQELFNFCKAHPKINYHGSVPNSEIRTALQQAHIYAYPNTWQETSCISLLEAMSAGLFCVHPNYGALYETAANWTWMYQWQDTQRDHSKMFYELTSNAIRMYNHEDTSKTLQAQKAYIDAFYGWQNRKNQWQNLLVSMLQDHKRIEYPLK